MQVCQVSASSSLLFLRRRILNIVLKPFMWPSQPIKFTDLDKSGMKRRGIVNKRICKKTSKHPH